jgi:hypothetical protein
MFVDVYPIWSLVILVVDFIIIYALATSADDFE